MAAMCSRLRLTATPPLRPASRASPESNSCAVPLAWAALPPLLAISRCLPRSIDAKPRLLRVRPDPAADPPVVVRSSLPGLFGIPAPPEEVAYAAGPSFRATTHRFSANGLPLAAPAGDRTQEAQRQQEEFHGAAIFSRPCPCPSTFSEHPHHGRRSSGTSPRSPSTARARP